MAESVHVHYIKKLPSGFNIAHVQCGRFHGDVPCAEDVQPGVAHLHTSLGVKDGRLIAFLKVFPEGSV